MSNKNDQQPPAVFADNEAVVGEVDAESSIAPSLKDQPPKESKRSSLKAFFKSPATKRYEEARERTRKDFAPGQVPTGGGPYQPPPTTTPGAEELYASQTSRQVWM
jgi:hypothetical protein